MIDMLYVIVVVFFFFKDVFRYIFFFLLRIICNLFLNLLDNYVFVLLVIRYVWIKECLKK